MKVNLSGTAIRIYFKYDYPKRSTEAVIEDDEGTISKFTVKCYAGDRWNKIIVRKVALARALEDGRFTRDERRLVWNSLISSGMRIT